MNDIQKYLDTTTKESLTLFKDKSLDFLGLNMSDVVITDILSTEVAEIKSDVQFSDLVFKTNKGYGIHIEEEIDVSKSDLWRFLNYNVSLSIKHSIVFLTIIISKNKVRHKELIHETLHFKPRIIELCDRDANAVLQKLKQQIADDEPINELDLIFLPTYKSNKEALDLLKEAVDITTSNTHLSNLTRDKIIIMLFTLSSKTINEDAINEYWEECKYTMLEQKMLKKFLQEVLEQGIEQGIEQGEKRGIERGIEQGKIITASSLLKNNVPIDIIVNSTGLSPDKIRSLQQ